LVYKLFRGRIQPTYIGVIIYLHLFTEVPAGHPSMFPGKRSRKKLFPAGNLKICKKKLGRRENASKKTPLNCWGFFESLRILAHLLKMMIGVYNHLRNERYLGSMKPFSEGEPGSLGKIYL